MLPKKYVAAAGKSVKLPPINANNPQVHPANKAGVVAKEKVEVSTVKPSVTRPYFLRMNKTVEIVINKNGPPLPKKMHGQNNESETYSVPIHFCFKNNSGAVLFWESRRGVPFFTRNKNENAK